MRLWTCVDIRPVLMNPVRMNIETPSNKTASIYVNIQDVLIYTETMSLR